MTATAWQVYDSAIGGIGSGSIDLSGDTFKCVICSATSNAADLSNILYSDLTQELPTANGYTQGGKALTNVTYAQTGGIGKFDSDDTTWTATGGPITGRLAVIYDDTATGKPLICVSDAGADVTASDGNPFDVTMNASGIFQLARG